MKIAGDLVHEALVAILRDGAARLRVDRRVVRVLDEWSDAVFSQAQWPTVVVLPPDWESGQRVASDEDEDAWRVELMMMDEMGSSHAAVVACEKRLYRLQKLVRDEFRREPHLRLARLQVFESAVEYTMTVPDRGEALGNNVMLGGMGLRIVTVGGA